MSVLPAVAAASLSVVSTAAGGAAALRWPRRLPALMALAGGVVLAAAGFDLLPEAVRRAGEIGLPRAVPLLLTVLGVVVFAALERLSGRANRVPDEGGRPRPAAASGLVGASAFVVHSAVDGLAIGLGFQLGAGVGVLVAAAVVGHDFADGLSTVSYLVAHGQRRRRARRFLVADALAPLVGAVVASLVAVPALVFPLALGFFAGLFVYAAFGSLLPRARGLAVTHALGLSLGGAAAMFLVTRVA